MNERFDGALLSEQDYIKAKAPLIDAWNKTPFLESEYAPKFRNDYEMAVIAQILENTKNMNYSAYSPDDALKAAHHMVEATTPTTTTAWSGATNLPLVLGYVRKLMPKIMGLELVQTQALSLPSGRVFYLDRIRHDDGTDRGVVEARAGWSYRSWVNDPGEVTLIAKSMKMTLTSADVSTASHKLKAETSIEFEQDLRAYHGLDGRAILAEAATDEMAAEISERILWQLWQARGTLVYYGNMPASGYSQNEWAARYLTAWNRADDIAWNKRRTRTNWAVVGSEGIITLGTLAQTVIAAEAERPVGDAMLQRLGTLNNRWTIYAAALPWPENDALLGYVGTTWSDACMFYLPYVPLMVAGTLFDPTTQKWTISWLMRDAIYTPTSGGNGLALVQIDSTKTGLSYPARAEYA